MTINPHRPFGTLPHKNGGRIPPPLAGEVSSASETEGGSAEGREAVGEVNLSSRTPKARRDLRPACQIPGLRPGRHLQREGRSRNNKPRSNERGLFILERLA